ncbi:recombinase family protein [Mycetocola zhadangensis]|uniref:Recombinase family protein n=1 Tax=Mycetocola zhadangensis TaxID=1164595 RepID=A0A3L7JBJ7_9MICO|nr:recombinase family protein [Mycetocola zhadangensis]RLQ85872.1 recombinase family protein [Mycetocola zhadangensis]GGE86569.1 hypothetical protein GCM10011313_06240 [Mycetocola zhadangensis]
MNTAAIYARQSEDVSEGIDRQVARCRALATARGYDVIEPFEDNDTSAFKDRGEATAWGRMLRALRSGLADVVIAVDLDRLLRSPRDLGTLIETGARLLTVDGEIDLTTADGEFRASMLASLARFEVRRKSERQLRANEHRADGGRPTPGRRRYGYETDGVTLRESEAVHVRRMFEHVAGGGSIRSMALTLREEGVDPAPGKQWGPGRVRYILTNPSYGGEVHRRGAALPSTSIEPVVDRELAEEVRAILADDARRTTPGPTPRYLGSSLATCGICDASMMNLAGGYRCRESSAHPFIKKEFLDTRIREEVALAFLSTGHELIKSDNKGAASPLVAALHKNGAAARRTAADRDEGLLSPADARIRLTELRADRESIEARLDALRTERSTSSSLADVARELLGDEPRVVSTGEFFGPMRDALVESFAALDIDRQRETARALLDITVDKGRDARRRVRVWHKLATHLNPDPTALADDYDAE